VIYIEDDNRRPPGGSVGEDFTSDVGEVLIPSVSARVKERDDPAGHGVDPREVRPFMRVAKVAGQGQVLEVIAATVLAGDDVLDVKSQPRSAPFGGPAVFAATFGPLPHAPARRFVHHAAACVFR
jgi:hypothetical protein